MPTTSPTAAAGTQPPHRPADDDRHSPARDLRTRPIESITRVNVAFPFATIKVTDADWSGVLGELAELVAALATQIDAPPQRRSTAELARRAQTLAARVGAG
jgi:hypothetical protein